MRASTDAFRSAADGTLITTYRWQAVAGPPTGVVQIAHGLRRSTVERYRPLRAGPQHRRLHRARRGPPRARSQRQRPPGRLRPRRLCRADRRRRPVRWRAACAAWRAAAVPVWALDGLFRRTGGHPSTPRHPGRSVVLSAVRHDGPWTGWPPAWPRRRPTHPRALAAFNAGFQHRTGFEWLSRDTAEVDAYVADPWCGWEAPPAVIPSLFAPATQLADPAQLAQIRRSLPILIASGDADPLAGGGALIHLLGQRYPRRRPGRCDREAVPGRSARGAERNQPRRGHGGHRRLAARPCRLTTGHPQGDHD